MTKDFPLWQFRLTKGDKDFGFVYLGTVITRGRDIYEAIEYMIMHHKCIITPETSIVIDAAEQYSTNHASGWLTRTPIWLEKVS